MPGQYLVRIVSARCLGFVYLVAFLIAHHQYDGLLSDDGLLPVNAYLDRVSPTRPPAMDILSQVTTVAWYFPQDSLDVWMHYAIYIGMALSSFMLLTGTTNWFICVGLWGLYKSIVDVGQTWYSFGWESQLLETGFWATFAFPVFSLSDPFSCPVPFSASLINRWLVFRLMLGAGLIKLRGDECWRNLTCMDYHYETQPVPSPLSPYFHFNPPWVHITETLTNHIVECVVPFFLFLPDRNSRALGGCAVIGFMALIILSGNLSFLNHLSMVPCVWAFDDGHVGFLFSKRKRAEAEARAASRRSILSLRNAFHMGVVCAVAYLSIPVVQNLIFPGQVMNRSFGNLGLVNTYGAFGSVTKTRDEVIVQGSRDGGATWREYDFKCKPGNVSRRPCLISPYHYRLDWLMWFAGFGTYQQHPWLLHMAVKLMRNETLMLGLMEGNPFAQDGPPTMIRMELYRYNYAAVYGARASPHKWWRRKRIGEYLPPVRERDLEPAMRQMGWKRKMA